MTFTDRLEGTPLENDPKAWIVCSMLDWCKKTGSEMPTERDFCTILGCFPKGKARRGEEKKGYYPQNQVHSLLEQLDHEGIVSITKGKGRQSNSFNIPEDRDLVADKKADCQKRKDAFVKEVWEKLSVHIDNGTANKAGIQRFIDYYAAEDTEYRLRFENIIADKVKKNGKGRFYIGNRWQHWEPKIIEAPTKAEDKSTPLDANNMYILSRAESNKNDDAALEEWLKMKHLTKIENIQQVEEFKIWKDNR